MSQKFNLPAVAAIKLNQKKIHRLLSIPSVLYLDSILHFYFRKFVHAHENDCDLGVELATVTTAATGKDERGKDNKHKLGHRCFKFEFLMLSPSVNDKYVKCTLTHSLEKQYRGVLQVATRKFAFHRVLRRRRRKKLNFFASTSSDAQNQIFIRFNCFPPLVGTETAAKMLN